MKEIFRQERRTLAERLKQIKDVLRNFFSGDIAQDTDKNDEDTERMKLFVMKNYGKNYHYYYKSYLGYVFENNSGDFLVLKYVVNTALRNPLTGRPLRKQIEEVDLTNPKEFPQKYK